LYQIVKVTAKAFANCSPAIVALAQNLRLKVITEGVETEEQLRLLRLLRCDEIQGYLFSKPLPGEQLMQLVAEKSVHVIPPPKSAESIFIQD
jgi:EAL domain-containing protein (putative c-di-GMP-specific phosphodiesterase class I)